MKMIDVNTDTRVFREPDCFVYSIQLLFLRRVTQVQKHRAIVFLCKLRVLQHLLVRRRLIFETVRNAECAFVETLFDLPRPAGACADSHHEGRHTVVDRVWQTRKPTVVSTAICTTTMHLERCRNTV